MAEIICERCESVPATRIEEIEPGSMAGAGTCIGHVFFVCADCVGRECFVCFW